MTTSRETVLQQITCPNCGASLNQRRVNSLQMTCQSCGTRVALGSATPQDLGRTSQMPASPVPLELGDTGTLGTNEYTILGRVTYQGWDEAYAATERWEWQDWLLGGERGRLLWLTLDEKGFTLSRRKRFHAPFNPRTDRELKISPERVTYIRERYPARITGVEGELTWRAKPNDEVYIAEGARYGRRYTVSLSEQEIEMYEGKPLEATEVAQAFQKDEWLSEIEYRKNNAGTLALLSAICFVFAFMGLVAMFVAAMTGNEVASQVMSLSNTNPTDTMTVSFNQANRPAIITVNLRGSLPLNTYADFDIDITSPDGTQNYLFVQEVWHESGYDEGEYWQESDYTTSEMFVPLQAGEHILQLDYDASAEVSRVEVVVTVTRNHIMPQWFLVYTLVTFCLSILLGWLSIDDTDEDV